MKYEYVINSPCKINLHLDVHNKRRDGYHNLTSIFQLISLQDRIFAKINNTKTITVVGDFDCSLEDNLIYKAGKKFYNKLGIKEEIDFCIEKNTPSGGGLGGGSSNCAAALRLLNTIYNKPLSDKELFDIALSLGSDVPFFLGSGTALVQGRGEIVTPLNTVKGYHVLVVNPSIHISTAKAFSLLNDAGVITENSSQNLDCIKDSYTQGIDNFSNFKNSFEIALFSDYTFINDIKTIMLEEGAAMAALSGSGSTMFGLFKHKSDSQRAKDRLTENRQYKIFIVEPLEDFPATEKIVF